MGPVSSLFWSAVVAAVVVFAVFLVVWFSCSLGFCCFWCCRFGFCFLSSSPSSSWISLDFGFLVSAAVVSAVYAAFGIVVVSALVIVVVIFDRNLLVSLYWILCFWTLVTWKVSFFGNSFSCTTRRFSVQVLVVPENINSKTWYWRSASILLNTCVLPGLC